MNIRQPTFFSHVLALPHTGPPVNKALLKRKEKKDEKRRLETELKKTKYENERLKNQLDSQLEVNRLQQEVVAASVMLHAAQQQQPVNPPAPQVPYTVQQPQYPLSPMYPALPQHPAPSQYPSTSQYPASASQHSTPQTPPSKGEEAAMSHVSPSAPKIDDSPPSYDNASTAGGYTNKSFQE